MKTDNLKLALDMLTAGIIVKKAVRVALEKAEEEGRNISKAELDEAAAETDATYAKLIKNLS